MHFMTEKTASCTNKYIVPCHAVRNEMSHLEGGMLTTAEAWVGSKSSGYAASAGACGMTFRLAAKKGVTGRVLTFAEPSPGKKIFLLLNRERTRFSILSCTSWAQLTPNTTACT